MATYRISKSAWLKDEDHEIVRTIGQRIEDMTGLTVKTAEDLQVANYGIGGHYEPHFDFARRDEKEAFKSLGTGNRIATVLFYVSLIIAIVCESMNFFFLLSFLELSFLELPLITFNCLQLHFLEIRVDKRSGSRWRDCVSIDKLGTMAAKRIGCILV